VKNAKWTALVAGALFAVGLVVGGMTLPSKVVGFLDPFGDWDPSLLLVMAGAIAVYFPAYRLVTRRRSPILEESFILPTRRDIDRRLLVGAALFGMGWGLGGFCPGPALTSLGGLSEAALTFVPAMFAGFVIVEMMNRRKHG